MGATGLAFVVFSPTPAVLWGLGTALGFPAAVSAASDGSRWTVRRR